MALWPNRMLWRILALLQLGVGLWMVSAYQVRAPLEVTYNLATLFFSAPWWGFPTPQGWSSRYQIQLLFGTDGLALWIGLAISLVYLVLSLWPNFPLRQPRYQLVALQSLVGFTLWTVFSYDLLTFYVGFEAVLIPMYYLILTLGPTGEAARKAALEFLLYTLVGSVPMLAGILYGASEISRLHGVPFSTNLYSWLKYPLPPETQVWVYGSFVLAFWVKLGLFPLHGWVTSLYQHVPLEGVVLSSAILTKLGGLGWIRIVGAFPHGHFTWAPYLGGMAVFSLLGAGLAAYFQKNLRAWLAYGTISHLSLVAVGISATTAPGISGAGWFLVSHALIAAAHLLVVAALLERTGTADIAALGGLARSMPQLTALWVLVALAAVGLPGLAQFPAELLVLTGSYSSLTLQRIVFVGTLASLVVSAAYTLPVLRRVLFGPERQTATDLAPAESLPLWALGVGLIGTGLITAPFLAEIQRTTTPVVQAILFQVLGIR